MDIRERAMITRETLEELRKEHPSGGFVLITSVGQRNNPAYQSGTVTEVSLESAARFIAVGRHRLSTQEEAESYRKQIKARADAEAQAESKNVAAQLAARILQSSQAPVAPVEKGKK